MDLKSLQREALNLDAKSRAELAERLLESLDTLSEEEISNLWADEAERRLAEYRAGRSEAVPADEVLREARQRLQ